MSKIFAFTLALAFVLNSCEKDSVTNDPEPPPPPTNTELLTNNDWQIKEIIQQYGNNQGRYVKGGTNTTGSDYSVARLSFDENGTGSFTDPLGDTYTMTWAFTPGDETKISLVVNYPVPTPLNYVFVHLTENNFTHTTYYSEQGNNAIASVHYIPVP